jgi:hypothetical protein
MDRMRKAPWFLLALASLLGFGYVLWDAQRDFEQRLAVGLARNSPVNLSSMPGSGIEVLVAMGMALLGFMAVIKLVHRPRQRPLVHELEAIGNDHERRVAKIVELTARQADELMKEVR